MRGNRRPVARYGLRFVALGYLLVLLAAPVAMVFYRAFQHGLGPIWSALTTSEARSAIEVTLIVAISAVVLNTVVRRRHCVVARTPAFPGRHLLDVLVDIPQAVSPIVVGLALILVYGKFGFFGSWIERNGLKIIFSLPGMVLATAFVSLPLVVRSVAPVLAELGDEQEQAARTLGCIELADVSPDHVAVDSRCAGVRRRAVARAVARRVRGGDGRVGACDREDADPYAVHRRTAAELRPAGGLFGGCLVGDHCDGQSADQSGGSGREAGVLYEHLRCAT